MPVKRDEHGRRYIEVEAEVPGTPEEVWQAIASGPGVSSWFVPTEIDGREGGEVLSHFSSDGSMDARATIRVWQPPERFVADSPGMAPGAPPLATEWVVEARGGGTCVVRVVHSWFADTDDWDGQFEGTEHGWVAFFRILRLYLQHFRGQPCTPIQLMGAAPGPVPAAWEGLTSALGIAGAAEGDRIEAAAGAPPLAGVVEKAGPTDHPELLLRVETPAPGLAHMFAMEVGGQVFLPVRFFLYGDAGAAGAAAAEPAWKEWLAARAAAAASA